LFEAREFEVAQSHFGHRLSSLKIDETATPADTFSYQSQLSSTFNPWYHKLATPHGFGAV
jgi:hypothetical protein